MKWDYNFKIMLLTMPRRAPDVCGDPVDKRPKKRWWEGEEKT